MGCMQSFITSLAFVKLSEFPTTTHVMSAYPRDYRWLRLSLLLPPSGHFWPKISKIRCINARICLQNHDPTDFGVHPFFQRIHPLSQEMSLAHCELVARSFQKDIFEKKKSKIRKSRLFKSSISKFEKNLLLFKNIFFIPFPHLPKNVILSFYIK